MIKTCCCCVSELILNRQEIIWNRYWIDNFLVVEKKFLVSFFLVIVKRGWGYWIAISRIIQEEWDAQYAFRSASFLLPDEMMLAQNFRADISRSQLPDKTKWWSLVNFAGTGSNARGGDG